MSRPREGWLSVGLLAVMLVTLAEAIEAAAWLPELRFTVVVALFSVAAGTLAALSMLPPPAAVAAGAVAGAGTVLWTVGTSYFPELDQLGRLLAMRAEFLSWLEIVAEGGYPVELTPYALGIGMLLWVTGFIAAFATFRHHRALDGVLVAGAAMVTNMAATYADLFVFLVVFVLAALLLLLRSALANRQLNWQARRLSQTDEVATTIMRSGVTFVGVSVAAAWTLTTVAVAAPLTGAWTGLDSVLSDVSDSVEHLFGTVTSPNSRLVDTGFGQQMPVTGSWESRDGIVLRVTADRPYYLRTATYDVYNGRGWEQSAIAQRRVQEGNEIFPFETVERPAVVEAREPVQATIRVEDPLGNSVFTPGYPVSAEMPLVVHEIAGLPLFGGLQSADPMRPGDSYAIDAYFSSATAAELAAAGQVYPPEIVQLYTDTEHVSPATAAFARTIVDTVGVTAPYHQARALADYLRTSDEFTYDTRANLPTGDRDIVDFFLFDEEGRRGYCQYFAGAMVAMARSLGMPARMAAGFAPVTEQDDEGRYVVRQRNAHAWAEIYFPGYGWEIFEATKSIDSFFTRIRIDAQGTAAGRGAGDAIDPRVRELAEGRALPTLNPAAGPGIGLQEAEQTRGGNAILIAVLLVATGGVGLLFMLRARRRLQLLPAGDRAWRQLERAAGRAGIGARPSETVYEYAAWLSDQIPARRPEIRVVADGKVWTDYSGRMTPPARQLLIERAWARLRIPLLVLAARRRLAAVLRHVAERG